MNMERFHIIEDSCVILRSRGVFRQSALYRRGNQLYGSIGGGLVELAARGGTSAPNVTWVDMDTGGLILAKGRFGEPLLADFEPVKLLRAV